MTSVAAGQVVQRFAVLPQFAATLHKCWGVSTHPNYVFVAVGHTHSNYMSVGKGQHTSSFMVVRVFVVVVPCPSKFCICGYGSMLIQILWLWLWIPIQVLHLEWLANLFGIHICFTGSMPIQILSSFCWTSSQPASIVVVFGHGLSETHTCLWRADADVDASSIGSVSIQGPYLCLRANFRLHTMLVVD